MRSGSTRRNRSLIVLVLTAVVAGAVGLTGAATGSVVVDYDPPKLPALRAFLKVPKSAYPKGSRIYVRVRDLKKDEIVLKGSHATGESTPVRNERRTTWEKSLPGGHPYRIIGERRPCKEDRKGNCDASGPVTDRCEKEIPGLAEDKLTQSEMVMRVRGPGRRCRTEVRHVPRNKPFPE